MSEPRLFKVMQSAGMAMNVSSSMLRLMESWWWGRSIWLIRRIKFKWEMNLMKQVFAQHRNRTATLSKEGRMTTPDEAMELLMNCQECAKKVNSSSNELRMMAYKMNVRGGLELLNMNGLGFRSQVSSAVKNNRHRSTINGRCQGSCRMGHAVVASVSPDAAST